MSLRFTKMHGLGNDYVYVSLFDQALANPAALSRVISDRHRGVGRDGLILVAPPEKGGDVRMIMFNADGSRGQMCGNGVRCVAKLAYERGLARSNPMRVETDRGILELKLYLDSNDRVGRVRVNMGPPILEPRRIPIAHDGEHAINVPLPLGEHTLTMTCVSMGNPHAVIYVDDLAAVPLREWGPRIERHALFPERINAHFVQVLSEAHIQMVTWERGSGPTQACGTGAAAVCVAGVLTDRSARKVLATLPGGDLELEWTDKGNDVFKTGPATEVFTGEWPA